MNEQARIVWGLLCPGEIYDAASLTTTSKGISARHDASNTRVALAGRELTDTFAGIASSCMRYPRFISPLHWLLRRQTPEGAQAGLTNRWRITGRGAVFSGAIAGISAGH